MAQVVDISDDDDGDIQETSKYNNVRPRKKLKCLNPDCASVLNLIRASDSIRRFYGVDAYCRKKHICQKCLKRVLLEKNTIINRVKSGINLFSKDISLSRKTYVLSDSDKSDSGSASEQSEYEYDPLQIKGSITQSRNFSMNSTLVMECDKKELQSVILDIIKENGLDKQILDGQIIIEKRLKACEKEFVKNNEEFKSIERKINKLRNEFYDGFRMDEKFNPSLEIGPEEIFNGTFELTEVISKATLLDICRLPPVAPLIRSPITVEEKVFVMKSSKLSKWIEGMVMHIELLPDASETVFQIQCSKDKSDKSLQKFVSAKNLAYHYECPVRIPVGTRIIAFVENDTSKSFYVGVIAEILTAANRYRYLVFFDDGYAQYVAHSNIRIVVQGAVNVWEDVEDESRHFIKEYLETYPERPMVRLQKDSHVKTELEGNWLKAQVIEIDCSLVKLFFPIQCRYEWIYRGSTRLSPLFNKNLNSKIKSEHPNRIIRRRTLPVNKKAPIVEYVNVAASEDHFDKPEEFSNDFDQPEEFSNGIDQPEEFSNDFDQPSVEKQIAIQNRTSPVENYLSSVPVDKQLELESQGYFTTIKCNISSDIIFSDHQCSYKCISESNDILDSRICCPLVKPLMLGWKRQKCREKKKTLIRLVCCYVAPCGRRLRTNEELASYLKLTESNLHADEFTLDPDIDLLSAWEPTEKHMYISDITEDKEYIHISCVNSIDSSPPKHLLYCSGRVPSERVLMNLDDNYLVCCSCKDDCKNKLQCECWQLTMEAANSLSKNSKKNLNIGYNFKRLYQQIPTGIYECNSRCSCKDSCYNRVVQFPIKQKLQLFKTAKRGWGIRTLNDIPKGTFICVYVGKLLTETEANEDGLQVGGDEYYANLDYIEVVENLKEGYESDVEDIETENDKNSANSSSSDSDRDSEDSDYVQGSQKKKSMRSESKDYTVNSSEKSNPIQIKVEIVNRNDSDSNDSSNRRPQTINRNDSDSNDSSNRRPQTFEPKSIGNVLLPKVPIKSMRKYYENDEAVYVMDSKVMGNVGRYFNHSCNPNIFVQNVFVDTHDPRFPWISFFAGLDIRAGKELTWDYNYEVGSVPGRTKYCYCGSSNCRGRLL